jgi:FkbM family methyltransferase
MTLVAGAAYFSLEYVPIREASASLAEAERKAAARCKPCNAEPLFFKPFAFTADLYGVRYLGRADNVIDIDIIRLGAYEKPGLFFARDALKSVAAEGGVFVDVGANTGMYSLFMSQYAKTVHAVEPYERVLKRFRRMIEVNAIDNIVVHAVGLGEKRQALSFFEPPNGNLGKGSFVENFNKRRASPHQIKFEVIPGDEIFAGKDPVPIDLIKIDVEGFEKSVLRGLKKTLRSNRPVVMVELTLEERLEQRFRSKEEFLAAFPPDYLFMIQDEERSHPGTGRYLLVPFDFDFTLNRQVQAVAFPAEKRRLIPTTNREPLDNFPFRFDEYGR